MKMAGLRGLLALAAVASAQLGGSGSGRRMTGSWREAALSTHAERLAEFAFTSIQGASNNLDIQGAEIIEVLSYRTQVLAA